MKKVAINNIGNSQSLRQPNVHSSYSGDAQTELFPTKEQAIFLDVISGVPIKDYAKAISTSVPSTTIRYISRITNNRICMYFSRKETADELTDKYKNVNINWTMLRMRPLITHNKRIIISNIHPVIHPPQDSRRYT